ncbi:dissimilatory-type sulfite reductase subunit alpha [Methanosarcinales archaeon]|nr:MAG: dissimilatory-type sulfite reductase subunit alpha [Methanosarcinales archaeon]
MSETPLLDELEKGPWPSFVREIKKAAAKNEMARDHLRLLERCYKDKRTHWKHGGIVAVRGYGGGVIGRYCDLPEEYPHVAEYHTIRINMPTGWFYTSKALRDICDVWDKYGSGLTNFHGSTGDIILLGCPTKALEPCFQDLAYLEIPFDIGGSGSDLRTPTACMGPALCEFACFDTLDFIYEMTMEFQNELHRPMWPYKFKIKASGCPNDCVAAKARADFSVIGTWKDEIQIDQEAVKEYVNELGAERIQKEVVELCPTKCMKFDPNTKELEIDNSNCVRCMHCINKLPKALRPGKERGATILIGGKATFVDSAFLSWVLLPFVEMKHPYDYIKELLRAIWDWWDENGKFRERFGELIRRVGMWRFLKAMKEEYGIDIPADVRMVEYPRTNPFVFWTPEDREEAKRRWRK